MKDFIYSIGLGPGDHELITVKAKRILEESDVIIVPQPKERAHSIAMQIVLNYIDETKTLMYYFLMHGPREDLKKRYTELAERIRDLLRDGKKVCYVTLGDPTIYSTSNYLTENLSSMGVEVRHVPGVSSLNAASSALGLPLCIKGEDFGVYEMPHSLERTVELIERHPTTVFMKVNRGLPLLLEAVRRTRPKSAYLVSRLGLEGEHIFNILEEAISPESAYLSVALIRRA